MRDRMMDGYNRPVNEVGAHKAVILTEGVRDSILSEGEAAYPDECCGFIIGSDAAARTASVVLPVDNSRERAEAYHRFEITPSDFLAAERAAAEAGESVVGIYHSHPDHPAAPSDYDLENALPYYSYLIVSVEGGKAGSLTSWRLRDDRSRFDAETLEVRQ
jgi:proteasome lid subunit RPN8/RPN11